MTALFFVLMVGIAMSLIGEMAIAHFRRSNSYQIIEGVKYRKGKPDYTYIYWLEHEVYDRDILKLIHNNPPENWPSCGLCVKQRTKMTPGLRKPNYSPELECVYVAESYLPVKTYSGGFW